VQGRSAWAALIPLLVQFLVFGGLLARPTTAPALEPVPAGLDADLIAHRADDNLRSDRTFFRGRMVVNSPRLSGPRTVVFSSWEDRLGKRSFIRIHAPPKDVGTAFLKIHSNLWMYIPRVESTMRIPPSLMLQSWMGSDFTNDDLVRESSEVEDYAHRLLGVEPALASAGGRRALVLEYLPHEDAPVVWGKIMVWVDAEHYAPLREEFYDERGTKLRVLRFSDFHRLDGRTVPYRWSLKPLDKPGHSTVIVVDEIRFDVAIDSTVFTTRNLTRRVE